MARQVLLDTQTSSDEVELPIGTHQIVLSGHAGGTWVTEYQPVGGDWIDLDQDFAGDGVQRFVALPSGRYRIRGGVAGAKGWMIAENGADAPIKLADGS